MRKEMNVKAYKGIPMERFFLGGDPSYNLDDNWEIFQSFQKDKKQKDEEDFIRKLFPCTHGDKEYFNYSICPFSDENGDSSTLFCKECCHTFLTMAERTANPAETMEKLKENSLFAHAFVNASKWESHGYKLGVLHPHASTVYWAFAQLLRKARLYGLDVSGYERYLGDSPEDVFGLESVWGENTNSFYDPCRAGDGGGYWQPAGGAVLNVNGKTVVVSVEDDSCGDFGTRCYATVETDEHTWSLAWGNMDDCSIDSEEEHDVWINLISRTLGVNAWDMIMFVRRAVNTVACHNR